MHERHRARRTARRGYRRLVVVRPPADRQALGESRAASPTTSIGAELTRRAGAARSVAVPRRGDHALRRCSSRPTRMRMTLSRLAPAASRDVLWINTLVLIAAASPCSGRASAVARGERAVAKYALIAAGALSRSASSPARLLAWQAVGRLRATSCRATRRSLLLPADGLHGLHLIGGLYVLGRTHRSRSGSAAPSRSQLRAERCSSARSTGTSCCWSGWSCSACCCCYLMKSRHAHGR